MMDVYEFSERDDQSYLQSKSIKQKIRKSKRISMSKNNIILKKSRRKRNKFNENNLDNIIELNPPIKLKLIRDQTDPQIFKSIQIINDVSQSTEYTLDLNQHSLMTCKLFDGREFIVNDVVWAKISGYPFWPSKILSINLSNQKTFIKNPSYQTCQSKIDISEEYIACVEWLAYDQISYVNCIYLTHFHSDFLNKYNGKIKNKKYFEAVNEAKNLCAENQQQNYECVGNHQTVDSVHSCETTEADTSSTLPSNNFTSPESNQSDRSVHCNIDYQPPIIIDSLNAHKPTKDGTCSIIISSTNWELPDLGSYLDFESNNHIPEFSDYEDDCENIDIAKIEFMIDETHKVTNT